MTEILMAVMLFALIRITIPVVMSARYNAYRKRLKKARDRYHKTGSEADAAEFRRLLWGKHPKKPKKLLWEVDDL